MFNKGERQLTIILVKVIIVVIIMGDLIYTIYRHLNINNNNRHNYNTEKIKKITLFLLIISNHKQES